MYTPHLSDSLVNTTPFQGGGYWTAPEVEFLYGDSGSDVATLINELLSSPGQYRVNAVSEIKCMAAQPAGISSMEPRVCFATVYYQERVTPADHDDDGTDYEDIPAFVEP